MVRKILIGTFVVYLVAINVLCFFLIAREPSGGEKMNTLTRQLSVETSRAESLSAQNSELAVLLFDLQNKNEQIVVESRVALEQSEKIIEEREEMSRELAQAQAENERLADDKTKLQLEIQKSRLEIETSVKNELTKVFQRDQKKRQREVNNLKDFLHKAQNAADEYKHDFHRSQKDVEELKGERNKTAAELATALKNYSREKESREKYVNDFNLADQRNGLLTKQVKGLTGRLIKETKDKNYLKNVLVQSESNIKTLRAQAAGFKGSNVVLEKKLILGNKESARARQVNKRLEAEREKLKDQVTDLTQKDKQSSKKIGSLEIALKKKETQHAVDYAARQKAEGGIIDLNRKVSELKQKIVVLDKDIQAKDKMLVGDQKELSRYLKKIEETESDLDQAKRDLEKQQNLTEREKDKKEAALAGRKGFEQKTKSLESELKKEKNLKTDAFKKLTNFQMKNKLLTNDVKTQKELAGRVRDEKESLKKQLKGSQGKVDALEADLGKLGRRQEETQQSLDRAQENIVAQKELADRVRDEKESLKKQLKGSQVKANALETDLGKLGLQQEETQQSLELAREKGATQDKETRRLNGVIAEMTKEKKQQADRLKKNAESISSLARDNTDLKDKNTWQAKIMADQEKQLTAEQKLKNKYYNELQTNQRRIATLDNDKKILTQEKDFQVAQVKRLGTTLNKFRTEVAQAKKDVSESQQSIMQLTGERDTAQMKFAQAREKADELEASLAESQVTHTGTEKTLANTRDQVVEMEKEVIKLNEALKTTGREKDDALSQTKQFKAMIVDQNASLKKTSDELTKATRDLASAQGTVTRLKSDLETERERLVEETREKSEVFTQLQALADQLRTNSWKLSEFKDKNKWLENMVVELETQVAQSDADKLQYRDDLRKTTQDLAGTRKDNAYLESQITQQADSLKQLKVDITATQKTLTQTQGELTKSQSEATTLKRNLTEKTDKLTQSEQDLAENNETLGFLQEEIGQYKGELSQFKGENTGLTREKEHLTTQLNQQTALSAKLQEQVEAERQSTLTYQAKLKETEFNLASARMVSDNQVKQISRLEGDSKKLNQKLSDTVLAKDKQITKLNKSIDGQLKTQADLTVKFQSSESKIQQLQATQASLTTSLRQEKKLKEENQKELNKSNDQLQVFRSKLDEMEDKNTWLEYRTVDLEEKLKEETGSKVVARKELRQANEQVGFLTQDKVSLEKQNAQLVRDFKVTKVTQKSDQILLKKQSEAMKGLNARIGDQASSITILNATVQSKDESLIEYQSQLKGVKGRMVTLDKERETAVRLNDKYSYDIKKASEQITTLDQIIADFKKQNEQQSKELTSLSRELRKKSAASNEQIRKLQLAVDDTTNKFKSSQNKVTITRKEVDRLEDLTRVYEKKEYSLKKDLKNAVTRRDQTNEDFKVTNQKIVKLIKEKYDLNEDLKKERMDRDNISRDLAKQEDRLASLKKDLNERDNQKINLQNKLTSVETNFRDIEVDLTNTKRTAGKDRKRLRGQLDQGNEYIDSLNTEVAKLNTRTDTLLEELNNGKAKGKETEYRLRDEVRQERTDKNDAIKALASAEEKVKNLAWTNSELSADVDRLKTEDKIKERSGEVRVREMAGELERARSDKTDLKARLAKSLTDIIVLEKKESSATEKIITLEKDLLAIKTNLNEQVAKGIQVKETELLGKLQEAQETIKRRDNDLKNVRADTHYNQAVMLTELRRYKEAAIEYDKAWALRQNDLNICYNYGLLYDDKLDSPSQAVHWFDKWLSLAPANDPERDRVELWRSNALRRMKGSPKSFGQ